MRTGHNLGAKLVAATIAITATLGAGSTASAQGTGTAQAPAPEEGVTQLEGMTVLGSRRYDRASDADTAVPVDVLPMAKAAEQGPSFDLAQTLQYTAPSFTSGRQTGADNADSVDSAALRGLGSDQTLVLVNGKRLHSTALVNLFGARNRGNTGT
ncbi:MAG: TonB-dependent receptor plug domain-containing protein, partial [Dokdonella sp.]